MPSRTLTFLVGIVATILIGWVLHVSASILQPLVIALFLCTMLQPVVRWLGKRHIPPPVTVILLVVILFVGFARTGFWVQGQLDVFLGKVEVEEPVDPLKPSAEEQLRSYAEVQTPQGESALRPEDTPPAKSRDEAETAEAQQPQKKRPSLGWTTIAEGIEKQITKSTLPQAVKDIAIKSEILDRKTLASFANGILGESLDFFRGLMLVLIYMLFIFAEQAIFRRKLLMVAGNQDEAAQTLGSIAHGIQRYLSVKTVISLATGILCYSVLEGLQVPNAPFFGFLTFILNYIPTFGSLAAGVLAMVTTFVADEGAWQTTAIVGMTYAAVNVTLGSYIEPRILGRELNLSPLVILISVVVWAGLWGIAGTFLAVPLTASMQIVLANHEATRPIAILLSSGPREERKMPNLRRVKKLNRAASS